MNIFNLIVIKGVNHLDININLFLYLDIICLEVWTICYGKLQMLAIYGFFYRRYQLFGGVIFLIVYACLATSFRTMITPVFLCVLSEALAMNHHLLTYLEKIYHSKGKQKLIIPQTSDLNYL